MTENYRFNEEDSSELHQALAGTLTMVRSARPSIADDTATVVPIGDRQEILQSIVSGPQRIGRSRISPTAWLSAAAVVAILAGIGGVWAAQQPTEVRVATPPAVAPFAPEVEFQPGSLPATWDPALAVPVFPAQNEEPPVGVDWSSPEAVARAYLTDRLPDLFTETGSVEVVSNDGYLAEVNWKMAVDSKPVEGAVHLRFRGGNFPTPPSFGWQVVAVTTNSIDASLVRATAEGITIEASATDIGDLAADLFDFQGVLVEVADPLEGMSDCELCPWGLAGIAERRLDSTIDLGTLNDLEKAPFAGGGLIIRLRLVGGAFLGITEFAADLANLHESASGMISVDGTERPWRFMEWDSEGGHCYRVDPVGQLGCGGQIPVSEATKFDPDDLGFTYSSQPSGQGFMILHNGDPKIAAVRVTGAQPETAVVHPAFESSPNRVIGPIKLPKVVEGEIQFLDGEMQFLDAEGQPIGEAIALGGELETTNADGLGAAVPGGG